MASYGMVLVLPSRASSKVYKFTCASHFIETLNTLSLPSPGNVTYEKNVKKINII